MHLTIREVMTPNPRALAPSATVMEAAHAMREGDIGNIIVLENGRLCGILTDRDIVVRALAPGSDPMCARIGDIYGPSEAFVRGNGRELAAACVWCARRQSVGCQWRKRAWSSAWSRWATWRWTRTRGPRSPT